METTPHTKTNNTLVFLLCASIPFLNVELFYQLQYIFVNSLPLSHHSAVGDNQFKSYSISSTLDLFHCLLETDKTDL
jgi:hypothetical protein